MVRGNRLKMVSWWKRCIEEVESIKRKKKCCVSTHLNAVRFGIDYIRSTGYLIAFARNNVDSHLGLVVQLDNCTALARS